jgi:CheY-like chemotaxis protein
MLEEEKEAVILQIKVIDNGIGISKEQQNKLFDIFEQADGGNTRKQSGIGIGLVLSKRIIEMMGGEICVDSEPDKGTKFTLTCKLQKVQSVPRNNPGENSDSSDFAPSVTETKDAMQPGEPILIEPFLTGKQILVVDDMEINRAVVKYLLKQTGAETIEADNGKKAVDIFMIESENIDLILMDIMMPEMDGREASRKIRASGLPQAHSIPIIALSAQTNKEDIKIANDAGMDFHLGKPVNPDILFSTLKRYLNS